MKNFIVDMVPYYYSAGEVVNIDGDDVTVKILDGHPFHHKTFVEWTLINGKVLYEKSKSPYFSHITHND